MNSNDSNIIHSSKAPPPVGAYPHARKAGGFLFLSGVGPRQAGTSEIPGVTLDSAGTVIASDIVIQTEALINNIKLILQGAGSSLDKIVDVQVFLTHMKRDFQSFNEVYAQHFNSIQATRTTIEVGSLPTPIAVEFKVIAIL